MSVYTEEAPTRRANYSWYHWLLKWCTTLRTCRVSNQDTSCNPWRVWSVPFTSSIRANFRPSEHRMITLILVDQSLGDLEWWVVIFWYLEREKRQRQGQRQRQSQRQVLIEWDTHEWNSRRILAGSHMSDKPCDLWHSSLILYFIRKKWEPLWLPFLSSKLIRPGGGNM
jgi:hypothetical protein